MFFKFRLKQRYQTQGKKKEERKGGELKSELVT